MGTDRQIAYVRALAEQAGVDYLDYTALYDEDNETISELIAELRRRARDVRVARSRLILAESPGSRR